MIEKKLKISGMSCGHCKMAVEKSLNEIPGVKEVSVNLEKAEALVTGEAFDEKALVSAIEEAGYQVTG